MEYIVVLCVGLLVLGLIVNTVWKVNRAVDTVESVDRLELVQPCDIVREYVSLDGSGARKAFGKLVERSRYYETYVRAKLAEDQLDEYNDLIERYRLAKLAVRRLDESLSISRREGKGIIVNMDTFCSMYVRVEE